MGDDSDYQPIDFKEKEKKGFWFLIKLFIWIDYFDEQ